MPPQHVTDMPHHIVRSRPPGLARALLFPPLLLLSSGSQAVDPSWADSYSFAGQCYCDTSYDHGMAGKTVSTPEGDKSVREVCAAIGPGPGSSGRALYNDVQCGNGPPNDNGDEDPGQCPGRVDMGASGCQVKGPTWNLSRYFPGDGPAAELAPPTAPAPSPQPQTVDEALVAYAPQIESLENAMNEQLGDQSCLRWPRQAKSRVTKDDWRKALEGSGAKLHYFSNDVQDARITADGGFKMIMRPTSDGSNHIDAGLYVDPTRVMTVTQTIRFGKPGGDYDFGRTRNAGKVGAGVASGDRPSGRGRSDKGATTRLMWRDGSSGTDPDRPDYMHLAMYVYTPNRTQNGDAGDDIALQGYRIVPGESAIVTMEITMNSPAGASNGRARAWVNGRLAADKGGIMWHRSGPTPLIDKISFSTFHGGADDTYSPSGVNEIEMSNVCWAPGPAGDRFITPMGVDLGQLAAVSEPAPKPAPSAPSEPPLALGPPPAAPSRDLAPEAPSRPAAVIARPQQSASVNPGGAAAPTIDRPLDLSEQVSLIDEGAGSGFLSPEIRPVISPADLSKLGGVDHGPYLAWADSYSVDGQCYCSGPADHGLSGTLYETPAGYRTVAQVCEAIGPGPGAEGNPRYNTLQCGHAPAVNDVDEVSCPGRVDAGTDGCSDVGPRWNIDQHFQASPLPDTDVTVPAATAGGDCGIETAFSLAIATLDFARNCPGQPAPVCASVEGGGWSCRVDRSGNS